MEHIHCQSVNHLERGSVSIATLVFHTAIDSPFFHSNPCPRNPHGFPQQSTAQVLRGGPPAAPGQELGSHGV